MLPKYRVQPRLVWRIVLALGLLLTILALSACVANVPLDYPNGNNATCWTLERSKTDPNTTCDPTETKWTDFGDVWLWRNCDSTGTVINEYKYDSTLCHSLQMTLLNKGHGDNYAHIYFGQDSAGYPSLFVWCVNNGQGTLVATVRQPDLQLIDPMPSQDSFVQSYSGYPCAAPVEFYVLTTGEYQVNIGPDGEGKISVMVFHGLPPEGVYFYNDDVDGTATPGE